MAHKNNEQNLIPNSMRTPEEVRENSRKGGIKSGEARRKKRDAKQAARFILELQPKISKKALDALANMGINTEEDSPDILTLTLASIAQRSMKGDLKAAKMIFELAGDATDARTQIERDRLKLERERLAFEKQKALGSLTEGLVDDGFVEALNAISSEVTEDASDIPEDLFE